MRRVVVVFLCGLLLGLGLMAGPAAAEEAPLRFAVLAFRPKALVEAKWQGFPDYLSAHLGRPVALQVLSLKELDEAVAAGKVDVVLTNSDDYVLLKYRFGLSAPLATMVTRDEGRAMTRFGGVIFTRSDARKVNTLADLAGRRVVAVDVHSLGGYQMQAMEMVLAGLDPPAGKGLDLTGMPQDKVVEAVLQARADVGFVRTGVLEHLAAERRLDLARVKVINAQRPGAFPYLLSTRLYPEWPVAVMPHVDAALAAKLTVALLSLRPADPAAQQAGIEGFTVPADYAGVEDVLRRLRMAPFDQTPYFTLADLWHEYAGWILTLAALSAALFMTGTALAVYARRARQAGARFATLFAASPEPAWILADARYLDCNPAGCAIFGVADKSALLGRSPLDFSPPEQPDGVGSEAKAARLLAAAEHAPQHFEWRHLRPDGSTFDAAVSLAPITLGGRRMLLSVLHDISTLKAGERALREAELFARATLDAVGSRLCVLDRDGQVIAVNGAWVDGEHDQPVPALNPVCGVGCAFLRHCDEAAAGGKDLAGSVAAGVRKVIAGRSEDFTIEFPSERDYARRWFSLRATRFQGDSGNVVLALKPISERKQWELRQRHQNRVLGMLARREPLPRVLDAIAEEVEALSPDSLCSILLLDPEGRHLRDGASPSLPAFYREAVDGIEIGPMVGSCGAAASLGQRVIVEDIRVHPNWAEYRDLARRAGLVGCWSEPIVSAEGKVLGTFGLYRRDPGAPRAADVQRIEDEAQLVALAIELSQTEERLQRAAGVFTHAREGILITDRGGAVIEVNDAFVQLTGYSRDEVLGHNPRMLKSGRQGPEFYAAMWQALEQKGHWSGEIWNRRKSGEVYAELLTISAVRDAAGEVASYVALFTDITHIKDHQEALERIAHFDALTGLPNRVLLADRLAQAMRQCERGRQSLAVLYLDLDGFKAVNDHNGHDVGDELLVALAQRMKSTLRQGDTLARIGGDEFVAVLTSLTQQHDCEEIVARLLAAVSNPLLVRGVQVQVSASIGVTMYPEDKVEADVLLRHADQAMYLAKQAGKNRHHHFDVARDAALKTQFESVEKIRRGLRRGDFELYYQPKVNLRSGAVIGAEALLRWRHPRHGLLRPAAFLPLLEGHALELDLGAWVLREAVGQLDRWQGLGLDLPVSVNVSASQLQQEDFAPGLGRLLEAFPLVRPERLELEVLESSAIGDLAEISGVIRACRELGVRFALDDFGTGYSSLLYLKRLPVDVVKIDQSFIRNLLDDPESLAIVEGVVGLARAFRREVVAEGVENAAIAESLLAIGCEHAQGFGIAHPMPAAELETWVRARRSETSVREPLVAD